jgi:hypothetical protein
MALYSQLRRQGLLSRHADERSRKGDAQSASGRHKLSEANAEGALYAPQVGEAVCCAGVHCH